MKYCPLCHGQLALLGVLGRTKHYRCTCCGMIFSRMPKK